MLPTPRLKTGLGALYEGDCLTLLPEISDGTVDLVFADPPFNLGKSYGRKTSDDLAEQDYLSWCEAWLGHCNRVLKPGGAMFVYNLPKWNFEAAHFLRTLGLQFRHWIAVEQKNCLPIQGRLYPAHYSLLYFTKGKPTRFQKVRTPIETCRHCGGEIRDYGGHRHAMNPNGVNLKDVWTDIPPVRHKKFKSEHRTENALSTKLVERVIEIGSYVGDLVLDPFGGSGTTFAVCEQRQRKWIGMEIQNVKPIIDRLSSSAIAPHRNSDFVELNPLNPARTSNRAAAE